jgi:hypothetical protein
MPVADPELRELLERLPVPAERRDALAGLGERLQAQDRASARRWRLAATALAALALPAVAATAVLATTRGGGSVLDRTVSCRVQSSVTVSASAAVGHINGSTSVVADHAVWLFTAATVAKGYSLDATACRPVRTRVPLGPAGLPRDVVLHKGDFADFQGRCVVSGSVLLHTRVHLNGSGTPTSAEVALWRPARTTPKPLAYVRWSSSLTRTWLSRACGA